MNRIKACFVLLLGAIVVMPARAQEAKPVPDRKEIYKTVGDVTLNLNVFLFVYEGQGHGFFNHGNNAAQPGGGNPRYVETVAEMDKFLESLGYVKAPGTRVP